MTLGALVAAGLAMAAAPAAAQSTQPASRAVRHYDYGDPEGRLMAFYSSAVAFSSIALGTPVTPAAPGEIAVGVEVSYIPYLSVAQRSTGIDKPEATNLAPAFPRPRAIVGLRGGVLLEAAWVPPVRVFDVKANLFSLALARPIPTRHGITITPRLSVLGGYVEGAITCNRETADAGDADLQYYYSVICYGNDSRDRFQPRHLSWDVTGAADRFGAFRPYVAAGVRWEGTRFDVGVIRSDGSRDRDQPILEVSGVRGYVAAGAGWRPFRSGGVSAEVFYAPGSLVTGRAFAAWRIR
ncbi:MAG TPA: hypothetical protein VNA89_03785 [Gemmatimonadaceae bacterium]|nr:hypothetical protein [Gemmatimonadaceae bacterium]